MLAARRCFCPAGGRVLMGWLWCPRPVHTSCSLGTGDSTQEVTSLGIDELYAPQQRDLILRLLNTASKSQLECVKELQGKRATSIVKFREQYGPFQDLNTLSQLNHFQPASMQRICDSVLTLTCRTNRKLVASFLKPDIALSRLQAVESIVSIVFGLKKMAWAHVDNTVTVREWQQLQCFQFMKGKYQPEMYLDEIVSVVSKLPQADFYILEKPSLSTQNPSLFPVVLHLRTVEAMLYCLLNPQIREKGENRVFSMTRNTVGKHFDIMLGELRTSGVDVVQRLIDEATVTFKPRINVPPELIQQYHQQFQARGQNRHEQLCDALLQALTFYELTVLS